MAGFSDLHKQDPSFQGAQASGSGVSDHVANAQNNTSGVSESSATAMTNSDNLAPNKTNTTQSTSREQAASPSTSDKDHASAQEPEKVGHTAAETKRSFTSPRGFAQSQNLNMTATQRQRERHRNSNSETESAFTHKSYGPAGHGAASAHKPILPKSTRGAAMRLAQHPPVGARPAAQAAMQYATAWKPRAGETRSASYQAEGIENAVNNARMPQSIQVFNVERNVAGLSRLTGELEEAEKARVRIAELDLELKAFDPFIPHTEEEYDEVIAKAREIASLRHEEVERSERNDACSQQEQRRNSDILSRAKELAAAAMKGGLNSELLAAVKTASRSIGTQGAMESVGATLPRADGVPSDENSQSERGNASANAQSNVGKPPSAYDDAFGGDHDGKPNATLENTEALNPGRDNGPFPNPQDYAPPVDESAKNADAIRAKYEKDKNESNVHHEDPQYWAQGGVNAAKSSSLPAELYSFDGPIQPGKEGINEGESDDEEHTRLERNAFESTKFDPENEEVPETKHSQLDKLGGLSFNRVHVKKPFHARGVYMPCFFLYDNVADQMLADEGSCRLMGITYTGEWIPGDIIRNQITLLDSEKVFAIFFSPLEGNNVLAHVRINQGKHQGERLYITGSVVQRDETGIATLLAGYFCQIQSNFMEYLYRIVNHCASYDIDTFADTVAFGYGYQDLLGLSPDELMPKTVHDYVKLYVHPEDAIVYKKQKEVIDSPANGDYYESIYRVKHSGGFYLWVIDRGLVVERKRSGKASRIIGTTTNIDVVRSNFERLKRTIYQDPLTGLHNRLYLNTRSKYFTMEESLPLTLCYVDISGLKVINDYLGHAKGDELVKIAAKLLRDDIHTDHEVIRLSGDEFLLIFTNCTDVECKLCMNKFACNLDERNRNFEFPLPIYFGFGVATLGEIDDGDTFMRCEARADARLQEYKTAHRERIYANLRFFIESAIGHSIDLKDNRRLEYLNDEEHNQCEESAAALIDDLHKDRPSCTSQRSVLDNASLNALSKHPLGLAISAKAATAANAKVATSATSTSISSSAHATAVTATGAELTRARTDALTMAKATATAAGVELDGAEIFSAEALAKAAAEQQREHGFDSQSQALSSDDGEDDGISLTIGVSDAHEVAMHAAMDAANHQSLIVPGAGLKAGARSAQTQIRSRPHFAFQERKDDEDNKVDDPPPIAKSKLPGFGYGYMRPTGADIVASDLASTPLEPIEPELVQTKRAYLRPAPLPDSVCMSCGADNIVSTFASDVLESELLMGLHLDELAPNAESLKFERTTAMSPFTPVKEIKAHASKLAQAIQAVTSRHLAKHTVNDRADTDLQSSTPCNATNMSSVHAPTAKASGENNAISAKANNPSSLDNYRGSSVQAASNDASRALSKESAGGTDDNQNQSTDE